jgi:hypothetical protein
MSSGNLIVAPTVLIGVFVLMRMSTSVVSPTFSVDEL